MYLVIYTDNTFKLFKEDGVKADNTVSKVHIPLTTCPVLNYNIDLEKIINFLNLHILKNNVISAFSLINLFSDLDQISKQIKYTMYTKYNDKISYDYLRSLKLSIDKIRKDLPYYPK